MDNLLQEANDAIQRNENNEMEKNIVADFESGFTLGGKPILPPLMTNEKRLEMKVLLLEAALKKKLMCVQKTESCATVEASTETLPPPPKSSSETKETNTDSAIEPLIVMGRFRQKLSVSKTTIHDNGKNDEVINLEPREIKPEPVVAQVVVEDTFLGPPQMAVELQSTPSEIQKSSWVTGTEELPILRRSQTCVDSTKLHHQLWRRNQLAGQRLLEVGKTPIKTPDSSESGSRVLKEETKVKPRSKIPLIQKKVKIDEAAPYITPGHEACYEPTPPMSIRCQSAAERRKNYDQKLSVGRYNMAKKREESLAKQKVVPKPNIPKSIRTPLSEQARLEIQEQRKRFLSMVARQADEQKYLHAEFEKQQQELMDKMLGDLIHATSEVSADYPSEMDTAPGSCSVATIASCNNTNSISPS